MFWDEACGLMDYWRDFPPVHLLVRSALGFGSAPGSPASSVLGDVREIATMFGGV